MEEVYTCGYLRAKIEVESPRASGTETELKILETVKASYNLLVIRY